jgi:hypothetical protein
MRDRSFETNPPPKVHPLGIERTHGIIVADGTDCAIRTTMFAEGSSHGGGPVPLVEHAGAMHATTAEVATIAQRGPRRVMRTASSST